MNKNKALIDSPEEYYIGLMSGTSMDALDGVLVDFKNNETPKLIKHYSLPIDLRLKSQLVALNYSNTDEIDHMALADIAIAKLSARVVNNLLCACQLKPQQIKAIGSHGQTIRHWPTLSNSLQIGSPSHIAEQTGITTISDFRRRDMAAGGQGAPLAPGFHESAFRKQDVNRIILNIGGISNITYLPGVLSHPVIGFDTGPGNTLLDQWIQLKKNENFDSKGAWAATGQIHQDLLDQMMSDNFFKTAPPKSTGRDYFNLNWLDKHLRTTTKNPIPDENIQATLVEVTALSITRAIQQFAKACNQVFVCGGGTFNTYLLNRINFHLKNIPLKTTDDLGMSPMHIEAVAFAWLAKQTFNSRPGNISSVTAASGPRILGAIYPA